ncbi:MAG: cupin domain-containing protein [Gammaproteobacteria bacterium]
MSKLEIKNLQEEVNKGEKDNAVGISLAHLAGTDEFSLYCTEISANNRVSAHYHTKGTEFYQIINGEGNIYVGTPLEAGSVDWNKPAKVKKGDFFMIDEGQVHQLHNTTDKGLVVIFGCASTHITTDRVMVDGYNSTNNDL